MFQLKPVQPPIQSIDIENGVSLVLLFLKLVGMLVFIDVWKFLIPCAPSRSKHCVDKVGGHHKKLNCTLNPPSASLWIEICPLLSIRVSLSRPIPPDYLSICMGTIHGYPFVSILNFRETVVKVWLSLKRFRFFSACVLVTLNSLTTRKRNSLIASTNS